MAITIYGYQHSVYSWIARLALREKGLDYEWIEIDPFAPVKSKPYLRLNPFNRVPTLIHGDFQLYETGAITRYIDEQFDEPKLQPDVPHLRAFQNQMISITDNDAYWPMVRQVFSHCISRPGFGLEVDEAEFERGLTSSQTFLDAISNIVVEGQFLAGNRLSLADIHLYPMVAYLAASPRGFALLKKYSVLMNWFTDIENRPAVLETKPEILDAD